MVGEINKISGSPDTFRQNIALKIKLKISYLVNFCIVLSNEVIVFKCRKTHLLSSIFLNISITISNLGGLRIYTQSL